MWLQASLLQCMYGNEGFDSDDSTLGPRRKFVMNCLELPGGHAGKDAAMQSPCG